MRIEEILQHAIDIDASDVFLIAGLPITYKVMGNQIREEDRMMPPAIRELIRQIYTLSERNDAPMQDDEKDDDFSFSLSQMGRFRVNVFHQRGSIAAVIRIIRFGLPDPEKLHIPESVLEMADTKKGIVLVTGSAGTGKSTTLACLIDRINRNRVGHIITLEDPIEYVYRHQSSIVTQREISIDTPSYLDALKSALRESPDVILLGEMRDYDTISAAITSAETGVLLLSTLHTSSAVNTINRILDVFPANQQEQVKIQLSQILEGIVCQQLVTTVDGELMPAFEIMKVTPAIRNMIRDNKLHQINSAIQAGASEGMITMDSYLTNLYKEGRISRETALAACSNFEVMEKKLNV